MPWTGLAVGVALFLPGVIAFIYPEQEDDDGSTHAVRKILGGGLMILGAIVLIFTASQMIP